MISGLNLNLKALIKHYSPYVYLTLVLIFFTNPTIIKNKNTDNVHVKKLASDLTCWYSTLTSLNQPAMIITLFKLTIRNILKNKLNATINIFGFSAGIAACLFIFLYLNYETSFDNFHPNKEQLYRITGAFHMADKIDRQGFTWFPTAPAVKENIPGIKDFCRVSESNNENCYREKQLFNLKQLRFTDDNFFNFFNFKLLTGNPKTVLNSADKIVLTEKKAKQIFGSQNPIGKTILYSHKVFTVSGIAANPPTNTQFAFDALASVKYIEQNEDYWKGWGGGILFLSYIELEKGVTPEQIEKALPDLLYTEVNQYWEKEGGMSLSASLQNIEDVHLNSIGYDISSTKNIKSLYVVASICFLILLLAVINYIILYSAQIISKTRNIGILKIHGAGKKSLFIQTFAEVLLIALFSSLIAIVFLIGGKNFLNNQLHTMVSIEKNIIPAILFLLATDIILSILITLISLRNIWAANSIDTIKVYTAFSNTKSTKGNYLLSFQFTSVIILLISIFVIARQNRHLLNHELGFNKENIVVITSEEEFLNNELDEFKREVQHLAAVNSVCLTSQTIGKGLTRNSYTIEGQQQKTMLNALYTDKDFLDCFKIDLAEGKNFSSNADLNKDAIIINQQMAKKAGWDYSLDKTIERDGNLKVIGIVKDFNFSSLRNTVDPLIIMANPAWDGWGYYNVNIRIQTSDIQSFISQLDKLWKDRFPETPFKISFLDDELAANYESLKAQQKTISFFCLLAGLIALTGLFGLTVFVTQKRIKEIGIRKVNGAKISEVLFLLNKDFIKWVFISFAIASPIAYYLMNRWLENFAYKTALSWWIFMLAGVLTMGISLITISWQSWKAATRNPVEALKYE